MSIRWRRQSWSGDRRQLIQRGLAVGAALGAIAAAPELAAGQATPMATPVANGYAQPETLADAAWLMEHQDDPALVIAALTPAEEFAQGHISGAAQIDWPALEVTDTSDASIARWRDEVEQMLSTLGITRDRTVVTYDDGTLFAARLWWVLHYLGHAENQMLNGGLPAWEAAGGELAIDSAAAADAGEPYRGESQSEALAQLSEVEAGLGDPGVAIVDARTPEEYAEGHIPGAVNINYPLNADPGSIKTWKPAGELTALYEADGVTSDKLVIPYCTTGVRSAVTFFTLRLIGYPNVSLFTGSWAEWSGHPDLPVTTGDQP